MRVILKHTLVIVTAETDEEAGNISKWSGGLTNHVFVLSHADDRTVLLKRIGPRIEACREPINISARSTDPEFRILSNLAHTPFVLDGREYASVEGFWQGLRFSKDSERRAIAELWGQTARRKREDAPEIETLEYEGKRIRFGTVDYFALMHAACWAKFTQRDAARVSLLATGNRPIEHKMRRDSKSIPGAIMAEIWMKVRESLLKRE